MTKHATIPPGLFLVEEYKDSILTVGISFREPVNLSTARRIAHRLAEDAGLGWLHSAYLTTTGHACIFLARIPEHA